MRIEDLADNDNTIIEIKKIDSEYIIVIEKWDSLICNIQTINCQDICSVQLIFSIALIGISILLVYFLTLFGLSFSFLA